MQLELPCGLATLFGTKNIDTLIREPRMDRIERGVRALAKTHWTLPRAERNPEAAFEGFVKHMRPVFEREVIAVLAATDEQVSKEG